MTITLKRKHGVAILACRGQVVRNQETPLLCAAVGLHGQDIILDLSHATAIDRSGIGALISLQAAGVFLTLKDPGEQILAALRLTHAESIFEICRSTPEAVPA
jgi:anti-anti-sigma regulatory factor